MDREKVIKGLEACSIGVYCGENCPYDDLQTLADGCMATLARDALELLKAQEAKFVPDIAEAIIGCKPKVKVGHCPSCDVLIHETDNFCRKCGQAVKWNG